MKCIIVWYYRLSLSVSTTVWSLPISFQDGTALPDAGISATDPEGSAVTYTISCGADTGYLSIDNVSGMVTMSTAFDLETEAVDKYTISCVVTGTDDTGQKGNATLDVEVRDGNDVAPTFDSAALSFYIVEGSCCN